MKEGQLETTVQEKSFESVEYFLIVRGGTVGGEQRDC